MVCKAWMVVAGCAALVVGVPVMLALQPGGQPGAQGERDKAGQRDAKVLKVLERAATFYKSVPRVRGNVVTEMTQGGEPRGSTTIELAAERPTKLSFRYTQDGGSGYALVSDGRMLHQYIGAPLNMYSAEPAPDSYAGMMDDAAMGGREMTEGLNVLMSPHLLLLRLLGDEGLTGLAAAADRTSYVGKEEINGVPHERVRLESDRLNVDVWVAEGERAWIRRIVPDMSPMIERLRESMGDRADELAANLPKVSIEFNDWTVPEELPADIFAYEAPAGAEKVESIQQAMQDRAEQEQAERAGPDHGTLLGKKAPALDLELLDGGRATIPAGKVVLLDFWATWCPPCVRGLPIIQTMAEKYKGKDVVVYAVNVQENTDTIRKFMERRELKLAVPLDSQGEASTRYGVSGIPQTVLIGKDGTVQAVHVGLLPDMEERLVREIDTLLKGEALVKP